MTTAPYGFWKSPITSDLIVAQSIGLSEVRLDGDDIYWLESRPQEGGRSVVVRHIAWNSSSEDVTPQGFNVRTRVHEYGGGAWTVAEGMIYFSNHADNRLYRMDRYGHQPLPLTPEGPWRYADGLIDSRRHSWIGVREDHSAPEQAGNTQQPVNTIVRVDTHGALDSGTVLASGHDFYSSPRLSPDGRWLAFLAWDHPNMPWMGTGLYVLSLGQTGSESGKAEPLLIAGGERESVFQPEWAPDGSALYFVSDRSGWWNLYRQKSRTPTEPLAVMDAEFGQPQWVFGMSTYAFAGSDRLVCSYVSKGLEYLGQIDLASGDFKTLDVPWTDFSSIRAGKDRVVFRAGSSSAPAGISVLNLDTGATEVLKKSTSVADDPEVAKYFSNAEAVEFPTSQDRTAFGLYYPAFNPDYEGSEGQRPPLLVKCHGGPTSAASSTLDLRIQYWTSRGIAVLDVNYGGSTGFGRAYRERLDSNWGIVDVEDCVNGARYLAEKELVDANRSVITGGSAGGYTVLAALTFHDYFRGGASYYGVSDPAALVRDTHKFESWYLDSLIGPYPEKEDLYRERSPIGFVERLSAPVIFFQGDEDLVVPVNQTELMVEALRKKGTPVGYLLFSGEQHGFRKAENIKRALDAELYFYAVNVFRTGLTFSKLLLMAFAFVVTLPAAEEYSYWIEDCTPETARSTSCEPGDPELGRWALEAWQRESGGMIALKKSPNEEHARLRLHWANGTSSLYGETQPTMVDGKRGANIYVLPSIGPGRTDPLMRETIVYLTCLHESGHALGLAHTSAFADIMYSFQYGGDITAYFQRYRVLLKTRADIPAHSGISDADRIALRQAMYPR